MELHQIVVRPSSSPFRYCMQYSTVHRKSETEILVQPSFTVQYCTIFCITVSGSVDRDTVSGITRRSDGSDNRDTVHVPSFFSTLEYFLPGLFLLAWREVSKYGTACFFFAIFSPRSLPRIVNISY